MAQLRALTTDELERIAERFRHPTPGGRIEAAKKYGIDLTLLLDQLRLSPAERATDMLWASQAAEQLRGAARRRK